MCVGGGGGGQGSEWNFCRREIEVHDKRWDMDGWMTDKEREVESSQESPECCWEGRGGE